MVKVYRLYKRREACPVKHNRTLSCVWVDLPTLLCQNVSGCAIAAFPFHAHIYNKSYSMWVLCIFIDRVNCWCAIRSGVTFMIRFISCGDVKSALPVSSNWSRNTMNIVHCLPCYLLKSQKNISEMRLDLKTSSWGHKGTGSRVLKADSILTTSMWFSGFLIFRIIYLAKQTL